MNIHINRFEGRLAGAATAQRPTRDNTAREQLERAGEATADRLEDITEANAV